MRYIISMEVVSSSRDSYPSLTKCFEKNTSLSVPTEAGSRSPYLFYENTCITLISCRKEKSVIFEKVSGNFFLKSYILNMIDFLKDIFHINSLKRCLAHYSASHNNGREFLDAMAFALFIEVAIFKFLKLIIDQRAA